MAEVITLSDDDDEPQILTQSRNTNNIMVNGVTAHIGETVQLDLDSLGIGINGNRSNQRNGNRSSYRGVMPLENSRQTNNSQPLNRLKQTVKQKVPRILHAKKLPSANVRAPPPQYYTKQPTNSYLNPGASMEAEPSIADIQKMIEATGECNPKRRSTRNAERKKIAGQFVCTYNTKKCVKIITGITEFITHLWTHVVNDYPETSYRTKKRNVGTKFMQSDEPTCKEFLYSLCKCQQCFAVFSSVHLKQKHVNACHINPKKFTSVCNICERDLKSEGALKAHYFAHHPNEVPYNCRKCKYRTSARKFMHEHYVEKHTQECLMCPMCLQTFDHPTSVRNKRLLFFNDFVDHMREHSTTFIRCNSCAMTFLNYDVLDAHISNDHIPPPAGWKIKERTHTVGNNREKGGKKSKIKLLSTKFLKKTIEGKRIEDEVACSSSMERTGYDTSSGGATLYICRCGKMQSYNGNRMASHFHRCKKQIDVVEKKYIKRDEGDDEEELKTFCVFPPFSSTELMNQKLRKDKMRKHLNGTFNEEDEIKRDEVEFVKPDDTNLLKCVTKNDDLKERVSKLMALYKKR